MEREILCGPITDILTYLVESGHCMKQELNSSETSCDKIKSKEVYVEASLS
jgi:hypothetical protein